MAHSVMVTGADGFIGSHLTEELVKRGEKVRAFCLYNSFGSLGWIFSTTVNVNITCWSNNNFTTQGIP